MLAFKRLVNVLVMVYLLLALLFILTPASRDLIMSSVGLNNDLATFYNTMFIIGAVLLALELLVENLYNVALQRDVTRQTGKVNELKARLYDHQMEQRDRELQQRPVTTAAPVAPATATRSVVADTPVAPAAPVVTSTPAPNPTPTTTTTTTRLDPVYVVPADPTPTSGTNLPPTTNPNVVETPPHSNVPPASAADLETPRPTQYPSSQP
ncbi:hypothetical protein ACW9KT_15820 [Hymenobacter sp. HD11105]